jgi:hypothetical protein
MMRRPLLNANLSPIAGALTIGPDFTLFLPYSRVMDTCAAQP